MLAITRAYLPRAPGDDSAGWSFDLCHLGGLAGCWCDCIGEKGWVGSGEHKVLPLPYHQPCRDAGAAAGLDEMVTMVGIAAVVVASVQVLVGVRATEANS